MNVNINKHYLVPKHVKISESEKKQLLEKYNINPKSLPKILKEDPGIIALHLKSGEIVKIVRKSKTAGETVYYRVVING